MQYVGEKEIEEVKLKVYYSETEANSFFFEDYGETFAYEQDIYSEKKFVVSGKPTSMTIQQTMEGLYTPRYENYHFAVAGLPFKPSKIIADGKEVVDFTFNEQKVLDFKFTKNFKQIEVL
jgi:alpha-glucosidase